MRKTITHFLAVLIAFFAFQPMSAVNAVTSSPVAAEAGEGDATEVVELFSDTFADGIGNFKEELSKGVSNIWQWFFITKKAIADAGGIETESRLVSPQIDLLENNAVIFKYYAIEFTDLATQFGLSVRNVGGEWTDLPLNVVDNEGNETLAQFDIPAEFNNTKVEIGLRYAASVGTIQVCDFVVKAGKNGNVPVEKKDPKIAFNVKKVSYKLGDDFIEPILSNPNNVEVSYSSSDEAVALVNNAGEITFLKEGFTTITATSVETEEFRSSTASYIIIVKSNAFSGGNGTMEDPYLISNASDLQELSHNVEVDQKTYEGTYFLMTDDIDMTDMSDFRSIGNNFDGDLHPFSGVFDGGNHKISNLNANWEDYGFVGLFGIIMNATVKNITLTKSSIYGDLSVGGIVGVAMADNEISNCHTTSDVEIGVRKFYIAGICGGTLVGGEKGSVIKDCTNAARIKGCVGYSAGIIGTNGQNNLQILRCGNTGEISDDQLHVAGIIAHSKNGISIIDCYNTGLINMLAIEGADNARAAGILAVADEVPAEENIVISNCYNIGAFNEESAKTHVIYEADYTSFDNTFITNCYYSRDVFSYEYYDATSVSLLDMKTQKFVDMLNNNRPTESYWVIEDGVNEGYPVPTNLEGIAASVENIESAAAGMRYVSGMVMISNVAAGAQVKVADLTGAVIATAAADAQGNAVVDMNVLPAGAYIVTADGKSIKVIK